MGLELVTGILTQSLASTFLLLAINAASRFYVTAATLLSERTTHIALFSLFQTVGFILGPGIMVRHNSFPSI